MDYEVRFCCEGCCPQLNVSGNPELTEYYENYPGVYILQEETFNEMVTYKQLSGQREIINTLKVPKICTLIPIFVQSSPNEDYSIVENARSAP